MGFKLQIITPLGEYYSGEIDQLTLITPRGQISILKGHIELVTMVNISPLSIRIDNKKKYYACSGGVLHVKKDKTVLLLSSIESRDDIDINRASIAKNKAQETIDSSNDKEVIDRARLALQRALNRLKVADHDKNDM